MAKKIINEVVKDEKDITNNEIVIVDNEEEKKEEKKINDISLVKPQINKKPQKNVRIECKKDHKCHIGGNWYVFNKGKKYNVPENVKDILMKADLLKPL